MMLSRVKVLVEHHPEAEAEVEEAAVIEGNQRYIPLLQSDSNLFRSTTFHHPNIINLSQNLTIFETILRILRPPSPGLDFEADHLSHRCPDMSEIPNTRLEVLLAEINRTRKSRQMISKVSTKDHEEAAEEDGVEVEEEEVEAEDEEVHHEVEVEGIDRGRVEEQQDGCEASI